MVNEPGEEVPRVAALLDDACSQPSRYRRFGRARELIIGDREIPGYGDDLGDDLDIDEVEPLTGPATDPPPGFTPVESAAWAAMRFEPDIDVVEDRERVVMLPHFRGPDSTDPTTVAETSPEVTGVWAALADAVTAPAARARFNHLLAEVPAPAKRQRTQSATDAYIEVSGTDSRTADRIHAARVSVRLARSIGDTTRLSLAITALQDATESAITGTKPTVGGAREGLNTLIREHAPRTTELIEMACQKWSVSQVGGPFWRMKLKTTSADGRERVWRDIVDQHIAAADAASSTIVRAARLRDALAAADESGIKDLRDRAAVLLQDIRHHDLEMMHIQVTTHRFEEEYEQAVAAVLDDTSVVDAEPPPQEKDGEQPRWYRRLLAFINFDPPTGDPDENRAVIEGQHRAAPLQFLFPVQLQTPEGLPLYAAASDEDRFDLDMVRWEVQLLEQWTPIMADALQRIARPEVPPIGGLAQMFSAQPVSSGHIGTQVAEGFERYWTGDSLGALYTTIPMIEELVRNAVLATDRGIFRLQKNQSPGQYVGLNALLPHFAEAYGVPERDERFFRAFLTHPGGWNVRNNLAHGYLAGAQGSVAAIALYAATRVILLAKSGRPKGDPQPHGSE